MVTEYLEKSGLSQYLDQLGFQTVGYGCTTCIGNSGPLPEPVATAITENNLVVASVLSGNRNFEGRVHALVKGELPGLAATGRGPTPWPARWPSTCRPSRSATATTGSQSISMDIWPSNQEVSELIEQLITPEMFRDSYAGVLAGNEQWARQSQAAMRRSTAGTTRAPTSRSHPSSSIWHPSRRPWPISVGARVLAKLGESVTTDHISPAGAIKADSPAGKYLVERGIAPADFNSYGSRRGNDRVMTRGTFANIRIRNQLAPGTEGGVTTYLPTSEQMAIYDAAQKYKESATPTIVLAGAEYGDRLLA